MGIRRLLFYADVAMLCEDMVVYLEPELCGQSKEGGHVEAEEGGRRGGRANHLNLGGKKAKGSARAGGREQVRSGHRSCGASKKPYIAGSGLRGGNGRLW